ncbi:MAG TPA: DUF362 domain-containing protein [Terriglobales bacterium]|nr:DUF362 domain-containing protein [Terriglobales bacterium]
MSGNPARIHIQHLDGGYESAIRQAFAWHGLPARLGGGKTVFLKPNLTFPLYRKGVMTSPECIEALVRVLKDYTDNIIVGEADSGGYNRFDIDSVFAKTGIRDLARKYGVRVVNLSQHPSTSLQFSYKHREFQVPFPRLLLEEIDLFITVPVPKIHMNTGVSMSIKNQWGCIPEPAVRLNLHPFLEKVLYEINKRLRPALSVIDGRYGLTRSGPMEGDPVELNWMLVADDLYAADFVCCHLMGIDPRRIYYLRYLEKEEELPDVKALQYNQDYRPFIQKKFYLRRKWTDYPGLLAFRSPRLAYLAYRSPLSDLLHRLLYLFREPFYDYQIPERTEQ